MSFWCLYCWFLADFTHCFGISIIDFEQENTGWVVRVILQILVTLSETTQTLQLEMV